MDNNIDLAKGIDNLLRHNNVDILKLILNNSYVPTEIITEQAKNYIKN